MQRPCGWLVRRWERVFGAILRAREIARVCWGFAVPKAGCGRDCRGRFDVPSGRVPTFTNTCSGASPTPRAVPAPSIARSTWFVPCCCSTLRPMTGRRSSTGRTAAPSRARSSRRCPSLGTARSRCVRPALAGGQERSWSASRNACARSGTASRWSVHDPYAASWISTWWVAEAGRLTNPRSRGTRQRPAPGFP
jgi:hypothetical protein